MRHQGTKTIETARLTLRPLAVADAQAMYDNWASDPAVSRYLCWCAHASVADTRMLLEDWTHLYATDPTYYNWGIVRKADGVLMGTIGALPPERSAFFEPGYCLGTTFWGQGYASEALDAMVDFLFHTVGMDTLFCCHAITNPASGHVMQKIGFVPTHDSTYQKLDGSEVFPCHCYTLTKENYDRRKQN